VKEIWSVLTWVVVWAAAWALRRTSWVAASQVQISWRTSVGVVGRRLGPRVGPASVIVDLFSPMVVSDAPLVYGVDEQPPNGYVRQLAWPFRRRTGRTA
jgi:hypothetical protein